MAVSIDELAGSPKYKFNDGRLTVTRMVLIDWADRETYMEELTPAVQQVGSDILNQAGQEFPGNSNLRVRAFEIVPFHTEKASEVDSDGLLSHEKALVTIEYAPPDAGTLPDNENQEISFDPVHLLSHQGASGGSFLQIKPHGLAWQSSAEFVPDNVPVGKFVGTTQLKVTWHRVPFPNWAALESGKGKVNDSTFIFRGFSYPFETLLYLGYDFKQEVMSDGERAWEIAMNFESKLVPAEDRATILTQNSKDIRITVNGTNFDAGGHNHFWNEEEQGFYRITKGVGTNGLYESFDFNKFFTQEQDD